MRKREGREEGGGEGIGAPFNFLPSGATGATGCLILITDADRFMYLCDCSFSTFIKKCDDCDEMSGADEPHMTVA